MHIKWTRLTLSVVSISILIDVQISFAVIEGDIELLKVVADGYEANLAKLKTWAGEANIVSSVSHRAGQGSRPRQEKHRAEFIVNRELDYEKVADVFVLQSVSHVRKDKYTTSERKAILTSKMVNGPASETEFLLGTLGLRPGDKIHDTRTNLMYIFGEKGATEADMPPMIVSSLINKRLPDFDSIKINLALDQEKDKMRLVCFFDMQQRPSRNCIVKLARQLAPLKEKGVAVIAIHASNIDENKLNEWVERNNIPFPVGIIQAGEKKIGFEWSVKALPWLILTNRKHIVTAEGFGLDELEDKIRKTKDAG